MMMMMMMMMQIDSYSAFYDNGHITNTELHDLLTARNIATVYVVGLATDYCVYYSAMDALSLGLISAFNFSGIARIYSLRGSLKL